MLGKGDVIVEIDGEDVRELSGDGTKDKLRQIGAVVTFVVKSKEALLEHAGGVEGEYDVRTQQDGGGGGGGGGGGDGSDVDEYAVRVAPPCEAAGGGGADGSDAGAGGAVKKKAPPAIKVRSKSVKLSNTRQV